MSLVAHLTELRNRIAKALFFLLIGTAVAFWWYDHGLGDFIRAPYCGLDEDLRYGGDDSGGCGLLITDVFGGVFIRLKVAFIAGTVLSAPFWLYQLWAFVTPGLKRNEKRYGVAFVAVSTLLFALGALLAYVSLSKGLELLLSLAGDGVVVALTAQDYIGFVLSLLVAFGVSFEVPLHRRRAQPGRGAELRGAVPQPALDLLPHHRLRRVRHADPGPVHHAADGRADDRAVRAGHPDRPRRRQAAGQAGGGRALPRPRRRRGLPAGRDAVDPRRAAGLHAGVLPRLIPGRPVDVAVLVSAAAGRGRARALGDTVISELRAAGLSPTVLAATTGAEAETRARAAVAAGTGAVVAVGGDGTAHAALQAVAGTATPLAVVPAGTGNDLALALGVPADPAAAVRALADDLRARGGPARRRRPGG